MKIEKNKLKNALSKISVFVEKEANGTSSKILFHAKDGKASVTSCDGTNIGIFSFPIEDKSELGFVTDYKPFSMAVTLRGDLDFEYQDNILKITQGETVLRYAASDVDTYAFEEKNIDNGASIKIDSSVLKKLIGKVSYARKEKDARAFITGVNLSYDGQKLKAESTDALRMLRNYTAIENEGVKFQGVLSPKCIRAIETMDENKEIVLSMNENAVSFFADDMKVYVPKLNCPYPDSTKFFEVQENATFVLDKDKTLESIEILSGSENKALLCKRADNNILFSMEDGISDVKDKIEMDSVTGGNFEFCLDFENFRDIFRNLKDGNKVTFYWTDPLNIILFKDEENFEGVVMPLRK